MTKHFAHERPIRYFSDKVRIGGAASGEIIDLDKSRTVSVEVENVAPEITEIQIPDDIIEGF